ncbi:MAG: diadenylate cyclase, partial [Thermodesulfobacteriota bacterium]
MDNLVFFFTQFLRVYVDWRVILDILLIAAALFFIYRTLRRLGSWKIVVGVLIATSVFVLAHFLNLRGIRWAYSNLSQVAVLGLIVLFQPEIRKVLERAASLKRSHPAEEQPGLADLLAQASFSLARQEWGAILVLPGREPIDGYVSGGFMLGAIPSLPLLLSIFDPNSPGHDGAVLVDNGRLVSLGLRLPLSTTNVLASHFGTRHHAAMGLSEATDALVVAVSEERGQVSVFRNGRVVAPQDEEDLAGLILDHWANTAASPISLRGPRKTGLAFEIGLCLLAAVALWSTLIYSQGEILERTFAAPVEFTATPENLALVGDKPAEVKLHLAGPKSDLDSLDQGHVTVKISLDNVLPGN